MNEAEACGGEVIASEAAAPKTTISSEPPAKISSAALKSNSSEDTAVPKSAPLVLLVGLAACTSTSNPTASNQFDGLYVGSRTSDKLAECGVSEPSGRTSARIAKGAISLPLFGPRTRLDGTVGADGKLRASGLWPNPTHGYPGMTVLNGHVSGGAMRGSATDLRCHTEIDLHKTASSPNAVPAGRPNPTPPHRSKDVLW